MNQKQNCLTYSKTITRRASAFTKLAQHCTEVDKNHVLPSSKTFTFKIRPDEKYKFYFAWEHKLHHFVSKILHSPLWFEKREAGKLHEWIN